MDFWYFSIFYLDDIEEKYYGEIKQVKKNITVRIESVNKGTILNIKGFLLLIKQAYDL